MTLITKYANALKLGPTWLTMTIYKKGRGPILSIECWSYQSGTMLDLSIAERQITIFAKILPVPDYKCRIRARRYYRKGN